MMVYGKVGILRTLPPPEPTRSSGCTGPRGRSASTGPPSSTTRTSSGRWTRPSRAHLAMITASHVAAPRRRVRRLRRCHPRAARARRAGVRVRARDRTAAPAGGPLRARGLRRAVRRYAGPGLGPRRAARAAGHHARVRPARRTRTRTRCSTWSRRPSLAGRVGESFTGVVVEADHDDARKGDLVVREPAVTAGVEGSEPLPVGEELRVTLSEADPATRRVRFRWIEQGAPASG